MNSTEHWKRQQAYELKMKYFDEAKAKIEAEFEKIKPAQTFNNPDYNTWKQQKEKRTEEAFSIINNFLNEQING